jgi:Flagellar hook-length control protein
MLPQLPAANSVRTAPAAAPRGEAAPNPFDQHLQAARSARPADTPPPADKPSTSTPAARAQADASSTHAAAKPVQGANVSTVATTSTAATASTAGVSPTAPRGPTDATQADIALLVAQSAPAVAEAGDAEAAATAKMAAPTKTAVPDEETAATLAGALLAMLGQVANGVPATSSGADDATVSADGSGQARAAVLPQGMGLDDKALAAAVATVAPNANLAAALGNAEHALAAGDTDTHKDHGLEALALATAPAPPPAPVTPALPQLQLASPPGSPGFAGELGQQVLWLGQQDIKEAKIRLHPEDLGSIDVHLSVSHDRVDVVFSAQHPAAVTAVQQSLPQLDQLLARHGLSLGHAEVGQQQNRGDQRARGEGHGASTTTDEIGEVQGASLPVASGRIGLLDAFA